MVKGQDHSICRKRCIGQEMSDETFKSITAGKQDKLEEMIDIEYGLLSKLVAYRIITQNHRTAIEVSFKLLFTEIEL